MRIDLLQFYSAPAPSLAQPGSCSICRIFLDEASSSVTELMVLSDSCSSPLVCTAGAWHPDHWGIENRELELWSCQALAHPPENEEGERRESHCEVSACFKSFEQECSLMFKFPIACWLICTATQIAITSFSRLRGWGKWLHFCQHWSVRQSLGNKGGRLG